jgi:hypothetical protein
MNISGRIHTGLRYNHKKNIQGNIKINSVMKMWRQMLEVKHNPQYLLLRQKTPPVTKNAAKAAVMIYK